MHEKICDVQLFAIAYWDYVNETDWPTRHIRVYSALWGQLNACVRMLRLLFLVALRRRRRKFTTSIQPAKAYEDESVIMSGPH